MKSDVVIVGGGPGGSACAMFLAREGIKPTIVEAESFPRYHIGESMSGELGDLLRKLGLEEEMLKRKYPKKQGVKVYGPTGKSPWFVPIMVRDSDWKLFDQFSWQVRRSDFDKLMQDTAVARGANLVKGKATKPLLKDDGSVRGVQVRMGDGHSENIESEVLLDCSGQATFLANHGGVTGSKYLGSYDKQIAIFSQVAGAIRDSGETKEAHKDNTLTFYQRKFHWAWFIPLDDEVVSVGVVVPASYFLEKKESKRDFLVRELRELNPDLNRRLPEVKLVEDVHVIPNYSYQVKRFCGKGFICVGDSHRFIDPIFSFGLYASIKEGSLVAPVVKAYLDGENRDAANPFADHQLSCEKGIDVLEDAIDLFWEQPIAFSVFVHDRYKPEMIDIFSGRIYERQPSSALVGCRKMLQRERSYDNDDLYSVPIGSRFHPERAPIWETNSPIQSTESWMGPR